MEGCVLCLELKKEFVEIVFNCDQWHELNIKKVLDKYLWPMNHICTTSWICTTCWSELYEFHKFYKRIEEAHRVCGLITKNIEEKNDANIKENAINEILESPVNELKEYTVDKENSVGSEENSFDELKENPVDECKFFLDECNLTYNHLQTGLMIEERKPLVKNELNEKPLNDINSLVQKRKRGRPRKDNCSKTNIAKSTLNKTKNKKRKIEHIYDAANGSLDKLNKTENMKQTDLAKIPIKGTKIIKIIDKSETKQEKSYLSASEDPYLSVNKDIDCDDRKSILLDTNCPPKIKHNEKDKFLAENFKITCFICNIPLETFFHVRKHFEVHHTERGHVKCCNKKFYRRSILVDHIHYHLNPNYFKCDQCGKAMADRRCLELHVETHENNHEKNHCCDICGKGFVKIGVLKKHRMIHLSEEEKRFSCSDCGKNFASNYLLSSHYRSVHLKKYTKICDICGKSIRCKDVFERHMLQHEGKPSPSVSCDICGLLLTDKKALKRHKDIIHPVGGQHEYTCSICSKTSPNLRAHKRHVQYKHVMGYDHKCTICDKAFKRAPTLKEHMASHTGTVLYTCPWCPKTFNSNANMHNHRKKVHPKEWEEASRKRYSGNLPPNYKPPITTVPENVADGAPIDW